ncbi:hypothetical protein HPB48_013534 [Haemaphysalis longicornis]|uniref:Uncharacterized protein n=1 Tax=Haemaphysalis longicornis TaxID=44386 RepID=A0A9J6GHQ8_HAELO|nr:hypothetical protein HPB48_013534 [Haemaphysalis longicornis]
MQAIAISQAFAAAAHLTLSKLLKHNRGKAPTNPAHPPATPITSSLTYRNALASPGPSTTLTLPLPLTAPQTIPELYALVVNLFSHFDCRLATIRRSLSIGTVVNAPHPARTAPLHPAPKTATPPQICRSSRAQAILRGRTYMKASEAPIPILKSVYRSCGPNLDRDPAWLLQTGIVSACRTPPPLTQLIPILGVVPSCGIMTPISRTIVTRASDLCAAGAGTNPTVTCTVE